jgi:FkbM family methyltransferase
LSSLRGKARSLARSLGVDLRRYNPSSSPAARRRHLVERAGVDVVVDAGAAEGDYAHELRVSGYHGQIVSFEPLGDSFERLSSRCRRDPLWDCHRIALGAGEGEIDVHVARDRLTSSLLPASQELLHLFPGSEPERSETVRLARLDAVADELLGAGSRLFLKLDVQGYEDRVLAGAAGVLDRIHGVEIELSVRPLYDGQRLLPELLAGLDAAGFDCVGLDPVFTDPDSGFLIQVDALFARREARRPD